MRNANTIEWLFLMKCLLNKVRVSVQVVILERRNAAGKILYKPVTSWNGSEEEKQLLRDELLRLQKDPTILNFDAMLPELNNEFASVRCAGGVLAKFQTTSIIRHAPLTSMSHS